jgi:hypothetical protein
MSFDFLSEVPTDEMPSVMTSRRERATLVTKSSGIDILDTPAFLRNTFDGKTALKHQFFSLSESLKTLISFVNKELTHPDDFPALAIKLNNVPELNQLQDLIRDIDKQGAHTNKVWVALISWTIQLAGSECQLTRHAARSIHSLSGAIAPDQLAGLMVQFNEKISRRESLSNALGAAMD